MRSKSILLAATAVSGLLAASPALAQEAAASASSQADAGTNSGQTDEIIVTAQRRAENVQNVPIAITTLSSDALRSVGVSGVSELNLATPGLSISTGSGGSFVLPRIRGVGQSTGSPGRENPVAIYIDDVYIASSSAAMFSFNSISQVAVLKGPQGTLFGRNATGGLIQVTTLDPSTTLGGKVSATYGNHDTYGGSLYLTGGLGSDAAADLAVYYNNQRDGFGKNLVTGEDVNRSRSFAIRSKFKASLGDRTNLTLIGDYSDTYASMAGRLVSGTVTESGTTFTGGKFDTGGNFKPLAKSWQWGASATLDHDLGFAKFKSISAYRKSRLYTQLDGDGYNEPFGFNVDVTFTTHERQFSQEFQLVSDSGGPFQWTTGLYYFNVKGDFAPCLCVIIANGLISAQYSADYDTKSYAGYAQGTYALTDQLNFTAGLRFTDEKRGSSGTAVLLNQFVSPFPLTIPSTGKREDKKLTWRLSLDYRPSPEVLAYLSYNRGFKSGGFSPSEIPYGTGYKPEVIDAYETGLKLDLFDRHVRINPSIFYYDYKNLQSTVFVNSQSLTRNAASAEVYGLDLDSTIKFSEFFSVQGGLSYIHARMGRFDNAVITTPNPAGGNIVTTGTLNGKQLPYTPTFTFNIAPQIRVPLGSNTLTFDANYYHNSGFYAEPDNRARQKAYDLFGGSITYTLNDRYSIEIWGKNLTNKFYALQIYTQKSGDVVVPAAGRTFGVTLRADF